ncbi:MAG: hypothetical protein K6E50_15850 [Lachnospiraceae bacterium]|nr:hypothetical protein [Lachnospiraceae bacterium]
MKITCTYCNSLFDDTLEKCPSCGATNANVRRSTTDQPLTIEELQEWYASKGLPPYETTRFFIGIDHNGPRAFGIYRDEKSGNFVVYKNKDNGSRAVRYEGSDEAYAVNELFQRLKQEIIEQKGRIAAKEAVRGNGNGVPSRESDAGSAAEAGQDAQDAGKDAREAGAETGHGGSQKSNVTSALIFLACVIGGALILCGLISPLRPLIWNLTHPDTSTESGYYSYNGEIYYTLSNYSYSEDNNTRWLHYDRGSGEWERVPIDVIPELAENKTAKPYYLDVIWKDEYGVSDATQSRAFYDCLYEPGITTAGYYEYEGRDFYHLDTYDNESWYEFSDSGDWENIDYSEVPDLLKNEYDAKDFYYCPDWDTETQLTDFSETPYYEEHERILNGNADSSGFWDNDDSSDPWDNDDSSDYDWDWDSDSWDSGSTDWDSDW